MPELLSQDEIVDRLTSLHADWTGTTGAVATSDGRWALLSTSITALVAGTIAWLAIGAMPPIGARTSEANTTYLPYALFSQLAHAGNRMASESIYSLQGHLRGQPSPGTDLDAALVLVLANHIGDLGALDIAADEPGPDRKLIAREREIMQLARSTLRLFSFTALGVLSVCITRADEKPKMRAVVAHEYGAPDVLKIEQVQRPEPNEDEALVRVIASSVNPADPLTLSGKYAKEFGTHLPLIPGYDIAGVVERTGANVTKLKVGDAVYGYPTFGGGWADYVTVKEWEVAAKPKSLSFAEAAAVPMGALTAWQALVDVAKLQPG